jgi:FdhE protein
MTASPWQRRIERAEELSKQFPFATEMLAFYVHVARFQEELHRSLSDALPVRPIESCPSLQATELAVLTARFEPFLTMAEAHGPESLRSIIGDLRMRGAEFWSQLLDHAWQSFSAVDAAELLTTAFLQPYAELMRARSLATQGWPDPALCPFCKRKAGLGVLRQMSEGSSRWLICTFCLTEWRFRRILCPGCGEEKEQNLPVFTLGETIRLECCDTCKTYVKTIDMTKDGHAEPIVDELASAPLDLWARDRGYAKLRPNLLGI